MEFYLTKALASLLLPPGGNAVLALLGLVLLVRFRVLGIALLSLSAVSLYALSTPLVADALSARLENVSPYPLKARGAHRAGAIVVLGGGRNEYSPEYGGQTVSWASLQRVRYAARLQQKTKLPILVTGGSFEDGTGDEATLMKDALTEDFKATVRWIEGRARTTEENARNSAKLLKADGIDTVYVVSHAAHLRRAATAFERHGIRVIPAPTAYRRGASGTPGPLDYFPSADALDESADVLHEWLGEIWYRWRYG